MTHAALPKQTGPSILSWTRAGLVGTLVLATAVVVAACGGGTTPSTSAAPSPAASPANAGALQNDFVGVVNSVSPSVVVIETKAGLGSGVVFNANGDILTTTTS